MGLLLISGHVCPDEQMVVSMLLSFPAASVQFKFNACRGLFKSVLAADLEALSGMNYIRAY